jgi:hypothetical protein
MYQIMHLVGTLNADIHKKLTSVWNNYILSGLLKYTYPIIVEDLMQKSDKNMLLALLYRGKRFYSVVSRCRQYFWSTDYHEPPNHHHTHLYLSLQPPHMHGVHRDNFNVTTIALSYEFQSYNLLWSILPPKADL